MNGPANRTQRRESRNLGGKFKIAKLAPVMVHPFLPGEGGMINQAVTLELAPIAGRLRSEMYAKVVSVAVPIQAVHAMIYDTDPTADITEVIRRKIMNGTLAFSLTSETEISKRCGVNPKSVGGTKGVMNVVQVGHNCAVNLLRRRKYIYATQLTKSNTVMTPAIIESTVLDRFNAALDPDDHINGNVELSLSQAQAPVEGIGILSNDGVAVNRTRRETKGSKSGLAFQVRSNSDGALHNAATLSIAAQTNTGGSLPAIYADLSAVMASGFSLVDLYNAQKADDIVRQARAVADANPVKAEEAVLRWAFGLEIDRITEPFVLYEREIKLGEGVRNAMDSTGVQDDVRVTEMGAIVNFSIPVPRTELGMLVYTFVQVRPDEVLLHQPHPVLTDVWAMPPQPAEMMKLDPEPVAYRELYSDVPTVAEETQNKFYVGHNELKRHYVSYGFTRQTDPTTVEAKTVMYNYAIPAGVTPDNILYPADFSQYPFVDHNAEVVTYTIASQMHAETSLVFGPTPVETVAVIDSKNLFG